MMKLLDTRATNTKVSKTQKGFNAFDQKEQHVLADLFPEQYKAIRLASLSLYPNNRLCAGAKAAGCMDGCISNSGRALIFNSVNKARKAKADFFERDTALFIETLKRELGNFDKLCAKQGVQGVVRLNVFSDIQWEKHGIPQAFPNLFFYDYTKLAARLGNTPSNYKLMFSYSGRAQYAKQVAIALKTDVPVVVVFRGPMPDIFLGRPVVNGDASDLDNVFAGKVVIGLKEKRTLVQADNGFVVDTNEIVRIAA